MTKTRSIGKAARLTIAGAGAIAVLTTGAVAASAANALSTPAASTSTTASAVTATTSTTSTVTTSSAITYRQAIRIAKKRVPGARVTEVEREWEHGYRVWKVELKKHHTEYRVYISVKTGKIIKFRQKHDD
ncbi:PepSY domain-containing protein [Sphaerisporangium sp. NPDC049002]|uniref:PepSY domain-containing protein n=1 Tax=unclassified Sphaerisporangium TaxID=2630420 RepID=UPI0033E9E4EF